MHMSSYNLKRHIELLNCQKNVLSQGKSFLKQNKTEFWELKKYDQAVNSHIAWEKRFKIASLIETFLNKEINAVEFHDLVFELRRNYLDESNKFRSRLVSGEIKEFFPKKESYKIEGFLSFLYFECENFEMN